MKLKYFLILVPILCFAHDGFSQCRLIDARYDSVYITYERVGTITLDSRPQQGVVMRLHNNSNCEIAISVESGDRFDLRRDPVLPDILYRLRTGDRSIQNSGDAFQMVSVPGRRSALFGVSFDCLDEPDGTIEVPFRYDWEDRGDKDGSTVSVEHVTHFAVSWLPKEVKARSEAQRNKGPGVSFVDR